MIVRARSATLTADRPAAAASERSLAGAAERHKPKPHKHHKRRHVLVSAAASGTQALAGAAPAAAAVITPLSGATTDSTTTGRRLSWASTAVPTAAERHLLSRLTFGFTQDDFSRLRARNGASGWLEQQLRPETIADPVMDQILAALPDMFLPGQAQAATGNLARKHPVYVAQAHLSATVARRAFSTRQLQAVMEDFWANHFYIPCVNVSTIYFHADFIRTLRDNALSSFETLLLAAEQHPAMLSYLSTVNSEPSHPNENQARELFELHTVGRMGGYTEDTVDQVARLMTGWTFTDWQVDYDPTKHVTGAVSALDWTSANADGDGREAFRSLLGYLAHHPATARFVCHKLAVRFVGDDPSDALVSGLAQTYLNNDTQIAPVLRAIVRHPEFLRSVGQKLRTPMEDCIASLRATSVGVAPAPPIGVDDTTAFYALAKLPALAGQDIFTHPSPDGFPDTASAWSTSVRATSMLQWHWQLADPDSRMLGPDASRPSVSSLLPRSSMRFDQWVDHLCRTMLGVPADDVQVAAACAATGLSNSSTVTARSDVATSDFPRLLVSLLDTPTLLSR